MADLVPSGDGIPTWLTAALSVLVTLGSIPAVKPLARWVGKRLDLMQQARTVERADFLSQTLAELKSSREEMIELRRDLGEERELRMALAMENAVLSERVDRLQEQRDEDKKECEAAIAALKREIRLLRPPPSRGRSDAP